MKRPQASDEIKAISLIQGMRQVDVESVRLIARYPDKEKSRFCVDLYELLATYAESSGDIHMRYLVATVGIPMIVGTFRNDDTPTTYQRESMRAQHAGMILRHFGLKQLHAMLELPEDSRNTQDGPVLV